MSFPIELNVMDRQAGEIPHASDYVVAFVDNDEFMPGISISGKELLSSPEYKDHRYWVLIADIAAQISIAY